MGAVAVVVLEIRVFGQWHLALNPKFSVIPLLISHHYPRLQEQKDLYEDKYKTMLKMLKVCQLRIPGASTASPYFLCAVCDRIAKKSKQRRLRNSRRKM